MTHVFPLALALLATTALAAPESAAERRTINGEVVDVVCSTSKGDGGRGESHGACAMSCARTGSQMAILTADALYLVEGDYAANNNARLLDFVARKVEVKGDVTEKDGAATINVVSMRIAK